MKFNIIVMTCKNNGIGYKGTIPWNEPEDMKYFRKITTHTEDKSKKNAVIMGRKTFESMGCKSLKNRVNYVLTKDTYNNVDTFTNLNDCLKTIEKEDNIENTFVIGGYGLYYEAMKHDNCQCIYMNVLDEYYDCDVFFPPIDMLKYTKICRYILTPNIMTYVYKKN
tara:strand:+ start:1827 stop:2324 length:498 start_codon:yes stop_codon:yes gene_type:complete